jgi:hypothetical protein
LLGAIINGLLGAKIQKSMGKRRHQLSRLWAGSDRVWAGGLRIFHAQRLEPEKRFLIDNLYTWIIWARSRSTWPS